MKISQKSWDKYKNKLFAISKKAADELTSWIDSQGGMGGVDYEELIDYSYYLATKYGKASAALAALRYDSVAELSRANVPPAEVAPTATRDETAKSMMGATKFSWNSAYLGGAVGRLVKMAASDTTLKNAKRDRAEFAWIAIGDTCPFCLDISGEGWKLATNKTVNGDHADHIHGNCDCEFAVRFNKDTTVGNYNPSKLHKEFESAEGNTTEQKINSMRRKNYAENKDEINEQKRIAYAKRKEISEESEEE